MWIGRIADFQLSARKVDTSAEHGVQTHTMGGTMLGCCTSPVLKLCGVRTCKDAEMLHFPCTKALWCVHSQTMLNCYTSPALKLCGMRTRKCKCDAEMLHLPCTEALLCAHSQAGGYGWVDDAQMLLPEHERSANFLMGAHAEYVRVPLADSTCVQVGLQGFTRVECSLSLMLMGLW